MGFAAGATQTLVSHSKQQASVAAKAAKAAAPRAKAASTSTPSNAASPGPKTHSREESREDRGGGHRRKVRRGGGVGGSKGGEGGKAKALGRASLRLGPLGRGQLEGDGLMEPLAIGGVSLSSAFKIRDINEEVQQPYCMTFIMEQYRPSPHLTLQQQYTLVSFLSGQARAVV